MSTKHLPHRHHYGNGEHITEVGEKTIEDNSNGLFEVKQTSVNVALGIDIEPRSLLLIESAQKLSYTSSP